MRSKNALKNIFTNLILQITIIAYGFVVPKIIISNYGSNVNGLITSITQFLGYITLLQVGFGPVVKATLYKPIAQKDKQEITNILCCAERFFKKIAIIFVVYILVLLIVYPLIVNNEFEYMYTVSMILIISISIFAEYYFGITYTLYLQSEQKTYVISLVQVFLYIVCIVTIISLSKFGASIHVIKLVSSLIFLLKPFLQNAYIKKKYDINLKCGNKQYAIKNKWDGLSQHIAAVIHSNTDVTVLTFFCNLGEVSVYNIYYLVVAGIRKIVQIVSNGIEDAFGDMIAKKEKANLNIKFSIYEVLYNSITTAVFSSTLILVVPFVSIYTKGIEDANYIRPLFATLLVVSEYIWAIRLPYSSLTLSAGHFKETRKGAWVECLSNLIISIVLVIKCGIIGVAIGTIVAMLIRTIEFIYHTNKYILDRSIFISIKKIVLVIIETLLIIIISKQIPYIKYVNYFSWTINAAIVFTISCAVSFFINYLFYKKEFKYSYGMIRKIFNKTKER